MPTHTIIHTISYSSLSLPLFLFSLFSFSFLFSLHLFFSISPAFAPPSCRPSLALKFPACSRRCFISSILRSLDLHGYFFARSILFFLFSLFNPLLSSPREVCFVYCSFSNFLELLVGKTGSKRFFFKKKEKKKARKEKKGSKKLFPHTHTFAHKKLLPQGPTPTTTTTTTFSPSSVAVVQVLFARFSSTFLKGIQISPVWFSSVSSLHVNRPWSRFLALDSPSRLSNFYGPEIRRR